VQLEPARGTRLVENCEARKGPGLPGTVVGTRWVYQDRLDAEVGYRRLGRDDLGALGLGRLDGFGNVQVSLAGISPISPMAPAIGTLLRVNMK
jgi:hypothetical protein